MSIWKRMAYRLHSEDATKPNKGFFSDVGYELFSAEDKVIPPNGRAFINTDLSFQFPSGYYGLIIPIPELVQDKSIDVSISWLRETDTKIKVLLINNGETEYQVKRLEKIAYMILNKYFDHYMIIENDFKY